MMYYANKLTVIHGGVLLRVEVSSSNQQEFDAHVGDLLITRKL